jgi:hypothetical protein
MSPLQTRKPGKRSRIAAKAIPTGEIDVKGAVELLSKTRLVREDQLLLETEAVVKGVAISQFRRKPKLEWSIYLGNLKVSNARGPHVSKQERDSGQLTLTLSG